MTQKKSGKCPVYKLEKTTGPDHDRVFFTSVSLGNVVYGPAQGKNKKESEQNAAKDALEVLGFSSI